MQTINVFILKRFQKIEEKI